MEIGCTWNVSETKHKLLKNVAILWGLVITLMVVFEFLPFMIGGYGAFAIIPIIDLVDVIMLLVAIPISIWYLLPYNKLIQYENKEE